MSVIVDPNEPQEIIDALQDAGFEVTVQGWLLCWKCECGWVFVPMLDECPKCHTPVIREGDDKTQQVRVGDIIDKMWRFAIERKRGDDYRSSCKDNRIYEQIKNLAMAFGMNAGVMLTDTLEGVTADEPEYKNWFESIEGWCWMAGIHFNECGSLDGMCRRIRRISSKITEEWKPRTSTKNFPDVDEQILGLMQCSGIGLEKAKEYFFYLNDLHNMSTLDTIAWQLLPKVGPKTAEKLFNFFHKRPRMVLKK